MFIIKDGTGTNKLAKVGTNHRLYSDAKITPVDAVKCQSGDFFSVKTGYLDVTSTGGRMLWIYYSETSKIMSLARLVLGWNGGDTNHNRALEVDFVVGDTAPTTNISVISAINANTTFSTKTISNTTLIWDGVGDGMTGHTPGITVSSIIASQGTTNLDIHGTLMVGPGLTLSLNARGEEAGRMTYTGWFYTLDPDTEDLGI